MKPVEFEAQEPPEPVTIDQSGTGPCRLSLIELTSETCRWPLGDVGTPDFGFCGGQALTGLPYCAFHSKIAYQPAARRDRRQWPAY